MRAGPRVVLYEKLRSQIRSIVAVSFIRFLPPYEELSVNKIYPNAAAALQGVVADGQLMAVGGFGLCGIPEALIAALRAQDAAMGILVISAWSTEEAILQALRAGATGYLLKERDDLEVMLSIRSVLRGGAPIDPFIARRVMIEFQQQPASPAVAPMAAASEDDALSPREIDILQQVANGLSHRETAERLHISRHTVEAHIRNIYRKLSVNSRLRAITEARARGLMD